MALTNIRFSKNQNIVADREVDGSNSVKVIAKPGFKGVYRWTTSNTDAREMARTFGKAHNIDFKN